MTPNLPLSRDIVLIGGGHTHALLLRSWGMDPLPGARLTLINPSATAPYTGMLPGHVAGHYHRDALEIDLVKLARFAGARMVFGRVKGIDTAAQRLDVSGRPAIAYDYASLDIGITSDMPSLPGFEVHAIAAKPLGPFADRWAVHLAEDRGPVAVIGGGVAGVELAMAMKHALGRDGRVTVVEAAEALRGVNPKTAEHLRRALEKADIEILEHAAIMEVTADHAALDSGKQVAATLTVGAAGARPFDWIQDTGLELDAGYVAVDKNLRSRSHPNIFAVGDCAHLTASPRPKAGVYAVRAAPVLTHNLKAAAAGKRLKPFKPQKDFLKLISLGGKRAIADKNGRSFGGAWAWHWKNRIDQRFMQRLSALPPMHQDRQPKLRAEGSLAEQPLCAGCGSKVSGDVLDAVLQELPGASRDDVEIGFGDDAAVLRLGGAKQVLTTDHLRAFWDDPWVFGRIAALHALGDVWAMGAAPQAVMAQVTLPRMTTALQERFLAEVMAAAAEVFENEGAAIVGGHSTQGAEMTVGFSVTGLLSAAPLGLAGAQPGDALVLTRQIGSGTLFAAEMTTKASGTCVERVLAVMQGSQGDAARASAEVARAMTDVTGFGLAGHAARMARASGTSFEFDLAAIPIFDGAEALAEQGVRSSLWQANRDTVQFDGPDTARAALMFDPQTAGGFLAAVPEDQSEVLRTELRQQGHPAEIVGRVREKGTAEVVAR